MARLETFRRDWIGATSALRGRPSRTIGHNTALVSQWAAEDAARPVSVRYHSTDVVTYRPDGWAVIRSGGWETVTTANRLAQVMPDGWRIASHRVKGGASWWLYRDGRPILPFASGLAVSVETGAIGMADNRGAVGVILTADDIAAVVAAEDAARQLRADKRTARILAQHPQPRPVTYRADVPHDDYAAYQCPLSNPHGRANPHDCASCAAEWDAWRAIVVETLRADHANGHAWAETVNGARVSAPAHRCPSACPDYAPYNYGTGY